MTEKQRLRAAMRAARDAFVAGDPPPLPRHHQLATLLRPDMVVASYVPLGREIDPAPLEQIARAAGCRLTLPHVIDRATPLVFLPWCAPDALVPGPFGLRQPAHDGETVVPDLVLTPLVAFDRRGNRLGQGAGHYDRAFAAFPKAIRIGVAWSVQEVAALDADPWDVPLHAIATEREWIAS